MRDINPGYPGAPEHRSIRNIPINGRRPHHSDSEYLNEQHMPPRSPRFGEAGRRRRRGGRFWLIAIAVVVIFAIAGVLLPTVFAGATVTVYPRQLTVPAPDSIEAKLSASVGELEYRSVSATKEANTTVEARGTQQVSRQASGSITISNKFSAEPQRLIANTRFESSDGKIYRIRESVTVPGMVGTKAGTIAATVYADSPGASYNKTGPATFTIPGFKGDPRYETLTTTSQGGIVGGFVGAEPAVAAADLQKAKDDLKKELEQEATAALTQSVPDGYGLLPGTTVITYSDVSQTPEGSDKAKLVQSATATGAIVNGSDLGTALAQAQVAGYNGESVALIPDGLTVSASSTAEGVITIAMEGQATLVWQFDPAAVREALLGKPKSAFQQTLASFAPAIECTDTRPCDARLRPFWSGTFPTDPEKISVITATEN